MTLSARRTLSIRIFAISLGFQAFVYLREGAEILGYAYLFFSISFPVATFLDGLAPKQVQSKDDQSNTMGT